MTTQTLIRADHVAVGDVLSGVSGYASLCELILSIDRDGDTVSLTAAVSVQNMDLVGSALHTESLPASMLVGRLERQS
jgi:hypothetical protein